MNDPSSTDRREVVFLVGGHGGIGLALSRRLAARGVTIVLAGRDETSTRAAVDLLGVDRAHAVTLDARDFDATERELKAWLVDPQVSWVTGQVYGVDGGLGTVRSR